MYDWGKSSQGDQAVNTLFRDILMGALGALALALIILAFHINPPKNQDAENERARGNVRVEVIWDKDTNVDIDTWVKAPGDTPVGYSNLNGRVFNLVRDDLGSYADLTEMNYEVAFSRGIPAGEWIINLHWFSYSQGAVEVPVNVLITMKKVDNETSKDAPLTIMSKHVILKRVGQELTVIRFTTDDEHNVDTGSFSTNFKMLRSMNSTSDHEGNGGP